MRAFWINLKIYYKINFRNVFLFIASYLMPIVFYLLFSAVFVSINDTNKKTIISSMCLFAITMNSLIGLPGNIIQYAVGDIKRAYIVGGIKLWHVFVGIAVNNIINCVVVSIFILFTAPAWFHAVLPESMFYFIGAIIVCILLSTLIGMLIGMTCMSESMSTIISQCIFLPSLFLSGIMMDVLILPKVMRYLSNLFPLTHMFIILEGIKVTSLVYIVGVGIASIIIVLFRYKKIIVS